MKTINELTQSLGISRQTFYNVVKTGGMSIDSLTTEKRGKTRLFDEKAEAIVKELLSKRCKNNVNVDNELDNLRRELAEAEKRISDQAEQIEKLRTEADALRENNYILIRTNATNAVTIQTLQQDLKRERALLTSAGDQDNTGGRIRRTIRKLFGRTAEKE